MSPITDEGLKAVTKYCTNLQNLGQYTYREICVVFYYVFLADTHMSRGGSLVTSWKIHSRVGSQLTRLADELGNVYSNSRVVIGDGGKIHATC